MRWSAARIAQVLNGIPSYDEHMPFANVLAIPELLRAFIPFAHAQTVIREKRTAEALAVIDEMAPAYKQAAVDKAEYWGEDVDGYRSQARTVGRVCVCYSPASDEPGFPVNDCSRSTICCWPAAVASSLPRISVNPRSTSANPWSTRLRRSTKSSRRALKLAVVEVRRASKFAAVSVRNSRSSLPSAPTSRSAAPASTRAAAASCSLACRRPARSRT